MQVLKTEQTVKNWEMCVQVYLNCSMCWLKGYFKPFAASGQDQTCQSLTNTGTPNPGISLYLRYIFAARITLLIFILCKITDYFVFILEKIPPQNLKSHNYFSSY